MKEATSGGCGAEIGLRNEASATSAKSIDSRHLFLKLIAACKRKDLHAIHELASARPKLLFCHDKHHRNVLHYAVILTTATDQNNNDNKAPPPQDTRKSNEELANEADRQRRCLDCFHFLLDRCAQVNEQRAAKLVAQADLDGLTILHLAVISGNSLLVRELLRPDDSERSGGARATLALGQLTGALASALDYEHHSPLHWAVITNNLASVRLLVGRAGVGLAHQADLNGATPLHYATQTSDYPKYRQQLRQMLKQAAGNSENSGVGATETAAAAAAATVRPTHAFSGLTEAGARREARPLRRGQSEPGRVTIESAEGAGRASNTNHKEELSLDILVYLTRLDGIQLECRDRDARTPLLWAASSGRRQAIAVLLAAGADPLARDVNHLGALHCAASHGFIDCLECLLNSSQARPLLSGAQINLADNLNCTPLFYAVLSGNIDCVELLLERGARPDWPDVKGRTAAHFAALKGQLSTLKLLETRGANLWLATKQGDLPLHYAVKSGRQQVVAWLLERSPYERAVNAINNAGRAPIHLAIAKGSPAMVEFLVRRGANLNQLARVRLKGADSLARSHSSELLAARPSTCSGGGGLPKTSPTKGFTGEQVCGGASGYKYETALDLARRLGQTKCLELLESAHALSASQVLSSRREACGGAPGGSLFEQQAAEVPSPIGFETSGSSAEPQSCLDVLEARGGARASGALVTRAPRHMGAVGVHSSDSSGSSALSQSSLSSVRGAEPRAERPAEGEAGQPPARPSPTGPFRGGLNYQNEYMNASIKCKIYNNGQHGACHRSAPAARSFPPMGEREPPECRPQRRFRSAANSLADCACANGQEIVTNVNVFTSPVHHLACDSCAAVSCAQPVARGSDRKQRHETRASKEMGQQVVYDSSSSSASTIVGQSATEDSDEVTSELVTTYYEGESDFRDEEQARVQQHQQHQARYMPPSQAYTQHLPVILSAEEERSTSGDTAPGDPETRAPLGSSASVSPAHAPVRPDHSQQLHEQQLARKSPVSPTRRHYRDQRGHQVTSPVAEYIHGGASHERPIVADVRGWQQQHQHQFARTPDYSQVAAKVDSHRNDSGLSSQHYADEPDGVEPLERASPRAARRAKSWSTVSSSAGQQTSGAATAAEARQVRRAVSRGRGAPGRHAHMSPMAAERARNSVSPGASREGGAQTCARQTVIRTRRLSVDSVELASAVEKSIRKYRQETKLFEELQNLKRSQIRSGRANEALLVKRLIERFRQDAQLMAAAGSPLIALDTYCGPYTYKAYELYLYDQLRKLSQSNDAKLVGARVAHKFTAPTGETRPEEGHASGDETARNYLDEDLRAELELQRVLNGPQAELAIEPSGALEEIRVRDHHAQVHPPKSQPDLGDVDQIEVEHEPGPEPDVDSRQRASVTSKSEPEDTGDRVELQERSLGTAQDDRDTRRASGTQVDRSAGSSRRSSAEVERDRLDQLPLRAGDSRARRDSGEPAEAVASSDETITEAQRRLETQAADLTAALITDALGNISRAASRACSPTDSRRSSGEAPGENDPPRASSDHAVSSRATTGQEDLPELDNRSSVETENASAGDEVETEAEADAEAEAEAEDDGGNCVRASAGARRRSVVNIGNKVEVIYHNVGIEIAPVAEGDRSDDDDNNDKEAQAESSATARADLGAQRSGEPTEGEMGETRAGRSQSESDGDELTELDQAETTPLTGDEPELIPRQPACGRRTSSPPTPTHDRDTHIERARADCVPTSRHASISSVALADQQPSEPARKVFTGFDLDKLRDRTRRQLSRGESVRDGDRPPEERRESTVRQAARRAHRTKAKSRPRRERSYLARGPYQVVVPIEQVRERWREIKSHERQRWRSSSAAMGRKSHDRHELGWLSSPAHGIGHAKSQPNLDGQIVSKRDSPEAVGEDSDNCSNFTLIYELNREARERAEAVSARQEKMQRNQVRWCQRKVARIVDLRSLKRTLSLPESVMYSNDLLKRFNVLKL